MDIYRTDFAGARQGRRLAGDRGRRAPEALIVPAPETLLPGVPVVAEEAVAAGRLPALGRRFWLVDPSTAPRSSSAATASSLSTSPSSRMASRSSAPSSRPRSSASSSAAGVGAFVEQDGHRRPIRCRAVRPPPASPWSPAARTATRPRSTLSSTGARWPRSPTPARAQAVPGRGGRGRFIRASAAPWNGTSPPAIRCWPPPPAAACKPWRGAAALRQAGAGQPHFVASGLD